MKTEFCDELRERLVTSICNIYGDNLLSIILYGSVARNAAAEDSDIDIAFLVKSDNSSMHEKMLETLSDLDLEYNQVLAPSLIEKEKYDKWKGVLPFYQNIEKEGIVLWKAV